MGSGERARVCLSECSAPVFDCKSGGDLKEHFSQSGVWEYPELKKHLGKHAFWEEGVFCSDRGGCGHGGSGATIYSLSSA